MVVPFGAGGGSDNAGRAIAAGFEQVAEGLSINVENREGGSGAVGYAFFEQKAGDPLFLLPAETAMLALAVDGKVDWTFETFTPIMMAAEDFTLLVVGPTATWKTCAEVVDAAKTGRVIAGISGATSLDNVVLSLTEIATGAKFDRVPFESGDELLAALLGGHIQIASLNPGEVIGQLEAGDLKALCAFSEQRYEYPQLAEIPTAKEQGVDVAYAQFRGLIAPGGIDEAARTYWIDVAKKFVETDAYNNYVEENFLQPNARFGDDFVAYLTKNTAALKAALGR
jgi:putative tricarboxylic transport membrane protein